MRKNTLLNPNASPFFSKKAPADNVLSQPVNADKEKLKQRTKNLQDLNANLTDSLLVNPIFPPLGTTSSPTLWTVKQPHTQLTQKKSNALTDTSPSGQWPMPPKW